jgi:hypothetical protein
MAIVHMWENPADAVSQWPQQPRTFITRALRKVSLTFMTVDEIYRGIASGRMKLWEVIDKPGVVKGAFVTEIVSGGAGIGVNVVALGGRPGSMKDWLGDMLDALDKYRAEVGAGCIIASGRPGWKRTLARFGWSEGPTTMVKVA